MTGSSKIPDGEGRLHAPAPNEHHSFIVQAAESSPTDHPSETHLHRNLNNRHIQLIAIGGACLLYTSPSPRDATLSRMPSSA